MKYFQIRFVDKHGHGSFSYFVADEKTMYDLACEKANAEIKKQLQAPRFPFQSAYKPFKTVAVAEYDDTVKDVKRGGIKFKLQLLKTVFKFHRGHSETDYSYSLKPASE